MNRGFFGIGVYHIKSEANLGTLFRSAQCFGADFIYTIGRRYKEQASDTMKSRLHMPLYHYNTLEDMRDHLPHGCRIVGVELDDRAWKVGHYVHPERCVYLLGAEDHGIPPKQLEMCHDIIQIPGASRCLNVSAAGSIVLFDRVNQAARYTSPKQRAKKLSAIDLALSNF